MLFYGVFRVCFCALFGAVAVMLLSQSTSAAAVLKNSCSPNDYLCNYIYQLKLDTHGLISELERRFPDLVNEEQNRDKKGSHDGLVETGKGNIQEHEEITMKPIQLTEDVTKLPLNNSLNENTTTERKTDLHDGISSTSQTPSKPVSRSDVIPTDQQSTPTSVPDNVEHQGVTSPTQSNHPIDSTTLSKVDPIASRSQDETTDGGSTLRALSGQSTTRPVPRSTSDSDDSVTQVALDDKTSIKPTARVTNEKVSSGISSVQLTSNSKPAPVTLGQIDVNGGSQFINKVTDFKATEPLTTDAKHKSSTQVSSMITKSTRDETSGASTNNPLRVMRVFSKEPTPSIESTEMDHQTTVLPVSLKSFSSDRSSTSNFGANTATGSTVKAVTQTDDTFGSGDTHLVSPYDVTEYSTVSVLSTITEAEATTPGATSASGSISESIERTPESDGKMTVIEGKWTAHYNNETLSTEIPVTEIVTEEIEVTTLPEISSPVNIRDATTRRALEVSRSIETTQSPASSQSRQTVGDAIQPEDISSSSSTPTKSTFETDVTILEDEGEVTTRRALEVSRSIGTTQSPAFSQSRQTAGDTIQPEDISSSSPTKSTFEKDVTILEDESEVTFVTILDDTTDSYKPTHRHAAADKYPATETIDEADVTVVEEIFVTDEMDVTTNVYDETGTTKKYVTTETVQTSLVPTTTIPRTTQEPTTATPAPPKDCDEIWHSGSRENGIYTIFPNSRPDGFEVFCDLQDNDGGWTVIQRRVNGSVNFYRPWFDYFLGFGTLQREFYLGNEKIHLLTNQKKYELSIRLWDFENESRYARYQLFRLGDYMSSYELSVRGYSGNAGNSLGYHSRGRFSTFDRDADDNPAVNCARMYGSGWWFRDCNVKSNLNGLYLRGEHTQRGRGITWKKWKGLEYSLRYSEMRIKPNVL